MIVVTIVGLMAAAIMPSMSEMMADGRQSSATAALVRLARAVREEAVEKRVAHRMVFDADGSDELGTIVVSAAFGPSCLRTPGWQAALGQLDMAEFNSGDVSTGVRIELDAQMPLGTAQDALTICFQGNGETWTTVGVGGTPTRQPDPIVFIVERSIDGRIRGLQRQVVLPRSGTARSR
jgi:type II secretory pathway pseudopilin PulG